MDDSGRLLDVCGITDDPAGYVELGAVLAERSGGFATVAVAADHDEHTVTMLLAAAGRALAIADEDSLDDYADRFGDDESPEEVHAPLAERRAIGVARALQAGVLAATVQGAPRELMALKPVLAAHGALATGRQAAAVALREVLRELYPAALRAYPDPTAPIPLAILDALPEPGLLGDSRNRSRDAQVIATLADGGLGDANRISEAVTALRVAIAETPRRTGIGKTLTTAVAETIQQSVAAVRAFDHAIGAVVGLLTEKATPATAQPPLPSRPGTPNLRAVPEPPRPAAVPAQGTGRRGRPAMAPTSGIPAPVSGAPIPGIPPVAPGIPATAGGADVPGYNRPTPLPKRPVREPAAGSPPPPYGSIPMPRLSPEVPAPGSRDEWPLNPAAQSDRSGEFALVVDPLSPTSYPSGLHPVVEPTGERELYRHEAYERSYPRDPLGDSGIDLGIDLDIDPLGRPPARHPAPVAPVPPPPAQPERVTPPWLADDLPAEPAMLRLVEPAPLADPALRSDSELPRRGGSELDDRPYERAGRGAPSLRLIGGSTQVEDESDGDLLIFSQISSAWFSDVADLTAPPTWDENPADAGWLAAEKASSPILGDATMAGLPRRVPQANLVPGSALPDQQSERALRVVRDPAAMAAHTTGYFRGSRRGEESRGFSIGGRPGRESAGGWDFTREPYDDDRGDPYEYRSAARR
ncbi:MAG TPA: transposase [Rugosimonospora sp.]|nr:transposase [Rugosimonospora sp.]